MYTRKHYVHRGERKFGPYYSLVMGYRAGPKAKQRHVAYLGRADTKAQASRMAQERGLVCGAWGCRQPPSVDIHAQDGSPARVCYEHADEIHRAEAGDPKGRSIIVPLA